MVFGPKNRYVEEKKDWNKVDQTDFSAKHDKIYDWAFSTINVIIEPCQGSQQITDHMSLVSLSLLSFLHCLIQDK